MAECTAYANSVPDAKRAVEAFLTLGFADITVDISGDVSDRGYYGGDGSYTLHDYPVLTLGRSWATIHDPDGGKVIRRVKPERQYASTKGRFVITARTDDQRIGPPTVPTDRVREIHKDGLPTRWMMRRR